MPGFWKHETRPILFTLVVNDFGVKCIRREHVKHLIWCLKHKYWTPRRLNRWFVLHHQTRLELCHANTQYVNARVHQKAFFQIYASHAGEHNVVHASFLESNTSQCLISNAMRISFCAAEKISFSAAPTQAPQKFEECSESRTLFWGDSPRIVPRSLSWKKSSALRGMWHKQGCMLETRAFFAFPEKRTQKQREGYVPPSQFVYRWLKSSTTCICNCHGLLSIYHSSGGPFEERLDKHLSRVSDTRHKVNILGNPWYL